MKYLLLLLEREGADQGKPQDGEDTHIVIASLPTEKPTKDRHLSKGCVRGSAVAFWAVEQLDFVLGCSRLRPRM